MREDWERFDRRHGHTRVTILVPWKNIVAAWKWIARKLRRKS